mmetsp:Transcript_14837/g.42017  ORF Transcript_14837/g.42017 Transcript_14837/m.42017 type:complete len:250 (-) Transcript_14837:129-878(-)
MFAQAARAMVRPGLRARCPAPTSGGWVQGLAPASVAACTEGRTIAIVATAGCRGLRRGTPPLVPSLPAWRHWLSSADGPERPTASGAEDSHAAGASTSAVLASLVERISKIEEALAAQNKKIAELEKRRGGVMQMVMQYGTPFALWYGTVWLSMLLGIYALLEMGVVSWQDSLRPLLASLGMDVDRIDPTMGNLVLAFVVNECVEPLRFPMVLATIAPIVKYFRASRGAQAAAGVASAATAGGAASTAR